MVQRWMAVPVAALTLAGLAALAGGCSAKHDAAAPAPTAASQTMGAQEAAGQAALHAQQGQQGQAPK